MITNEERREVAARLRDIDRTITNSHSVEEAVNSFFYAVCGHKGFSPIEVSVRNLCGAAAKLADLIEPEERTCTYEPDVVYSWFDDDDVEHDTDLADDSADMTCSRCGYFMLIDWFDKEEGEHGGWKTTPMFNFCPHCGAKVVE